MELILTKSPDRFLDLTLPHGEKVRLNIRRFTVLESSKIQDMLKQLKSDYDTDKINSQEYFDGSMSASISNWDDIKDKTLESGLESEHIKKIMESIEKLRKEKEPTEKKIQ